MDTPVTLRGLVDTAGLNLRPLPDLRLSEQAWEREVLWVHSSDLPDPSPFLERGVVLLTTGTQFGPDLADDDEAWSAYVQRLVAAGVAALGFGTEVARSGVPLPLARACSGEGLPLFEVPFQTPFIAVARANVEAVAARDEAQRTWALDAHRALARAALGPDAARSTVRVLAQQVHGWVGLLDAAGEISATHAPSSAQRPSGMELSAIAEEAGALLRRASRAAGTTRTGEREFSLQTLGGSGRLTGVLAVEVTSNAPEMVSVLTSAVALLGLATGRAERLLDAQLDLRSGLIELLLDGQVKLAAAVASAASEPLPPAPVTVLLGGEPAMASHLTQWLSARPAGTRKGVLAGRHGQHCLALVSPAAAPQAAQEIARELGDAWGLSEPHALTDLKDAVMQADLARSEPGLTRYGDAVGHDVLPMVRSERAETAARHALQPLVEHDRRNGTDLVPTLEAWLRHNGRHEETAVELGVHRHTVRTRVRLAERVLGHSLQDFEHRAQLWMAIRLLE
jgi:purine catabolism regulator